MCLGIPMQVQALSAGHAECCGRGLQRRVRTSLIESPAAGDWLLVHLDNAIERISATRAAEVNAALDLLDQAMRGLTGPLDDPGFALPSAMDPSLLAALSGQTDAQTLMRQRP